MAPVVLFKVFFEKSHLLIGRKVVHSLAIAVRGAFNGGVGISLGWRAPCSTFANCIQFVFAWFEIVPVHEKVSLVGYGSKTRRHYFPIAIRCSRARKKSVPSQIAGEAMHVSPKVFVATIESFVATSAT